MKPPHSNSEATDIRLSDLGTGGDCEMADLDGSLLGKDVYNGKGHHVGWVDDVWQSKDGKWFLQVTRPKNWYLPFSFLTYLIAVPKDRLFSAEWRVVVDEFDHYEFAAEDQEDVTDVCYARGLQSLRSHIAMNGESNEPPYLEQWYL